MAYANAQLGLIAFNKDQSQKSNQYFEESLRLDPTNLEVIGTYGDTLLKQADQTQGADALYLKAEALFAQAIQMAPNDKRFQISYGRSLANQKKYQLALRYLKQALGEQNAYEEMAHIYHLHMEYDKAALAMSKAHEIHTKKQMLASRQQRPGNVNPPTQNASQQTGGYAVSQPRTDAGMPDQIAQSMTNAYDPQYHQHQMMPNQIPVAQNFQGQNHQGQTPQSQSSSQPMTALQQVIRRQQTAAQQPMQTQPMMQQQSVTQQQMIQPPIVQQQMPTPSNVMSTNVNPQVDGFASSVPGQPLAQNASQQQMTQQPMQPQPVMQQPVMQQPGQQIQPPVGQPYQPPYGFAGQMPPTTSAMPGQASPFVGDSQEIAYRRNRQADQNASIPVVVNPLTDQTITATNMTTETASNAFSFNAFSEEQSAPPTGRNSSGAVPTGSPNSASTPTFSGFQAF